MLRLIPRSFCALKSVAPEGSVLTMWRLGKVFAEMFYEAIGFRAHAMYVGWVYVLDSRCGSKQWTTEVVEQVCQ